ncbi:hypothetical protein BMW23_0902 [Bodo saltans virus]|uniref:Uncharacterized protein n=1 Tax=Bodo saltans virus TaxID=2024608 RepID=A0A2H4UVP7_9VIRU|nr:hypothetical protein QJ851_gp0884 [Bodo saltans virus]ATZ80947.1 hypothetical protein BMW23_0902 [Bodo saltans virus]
MCIKIKELCYSIIGLFNKCAHEYDLEYSEMKKDDDMINEQNNKMLHCPVVIMMDSNTNNILSTPLKDNVNIKQKKEEEWEFL